ncbi:Protein bimA [Madurella mycetomatis]|uniref:Protein bimA n=1 Tax=Madurella mycetomatis TaxID=100816 RepID=A0A175VP61_9PEZI|nr:Protein bimA [Madurella mycetomatis]
MAPNSAAIASLLKQTVHYHLDSLAYQNALFFAERLHAHDPRSPESAYLVALCHFRLGDSRSAYEVSKPAGSRGVHVGCAFILAQSCLDLERYKDGITALEKARPLWGSKCSAGRHTASTRAPYPDAAAISCLLGKLYRAYDDKKKAVQCFEDSLRTNPFMWDAFTVLCDMGVNVRIPNIFKLNDAFARTFDQEPGTANVESNGGVPEPLQKKPGIQAVSHDTDPFEGHRSTAFQDISSNNMLFAEPGENDVVAKFAVVHSRYAANQANKYGFDGVETPTGPTAPGHETQQTRNGFGPEPPLAPTRRTRATQPTESNLLDAPSRMGHRLGWKKREKAQDQPGDLPESMLRGSALSLSTMERKRTASGQPRPTNGEEPRRSARLNVVSRTAASRANTSATAIGAPVTRELKKARPPVSRIVRPGSSGASVGRVVSGNRKPLEESSMDVDQAEAPRVRELPAAQALPPKPAEPEPVKVDEGLKWILDLLKKMATGYLLSSQFQCQDALTAFSSLPRTHQETPWVLARMGRAQYEQANYVEAEKFFRRLRKLAPARHDDMEVYSTVLWHLRKETDLSFLAHELIDAVWDSPQAWCALGNAWSLACDHEQALRCFKRAIQLHPNFAYAYTLQGHEHVENEEYDKALTAYRHAIAADKRHYNAYYGIGKVYEKLGNYEKAWSHYHAASAIHPTHAVLICCMGTVLQRQKQVAQALPFFHKAVELAPRAAEIRHKKARALLATGQLEEAQHELMILRDLAPDKAQVHFLLGKLAKTLGDRKSAVRHFTIALSLDPKASGQIKQEIGGLEDDDSLDDSMMH